MEKRFKLFVYEEGEPPLVHDGPCKNIYTTEGRFIHELELGRTRFRTMDPTTAHVYFMPFSVTMMVTFLYQPVPHNPLPLRCFVSDYVRVVSTKYPFWNSSLGTDHFMLSCHDWVSIYAYNMYVTLGKNVPYDQSFRLLLSNRDPEILEFSSNLGLQ